MHIIFLFVFILFLKSIGDIGLRMLRIKDISRSAIVSFSFGFAITSYMLRLVFSRAVPGDYIFTAIICLVILFNIRTLSQFLKDLLKRAAEFFSQECDAFERVILLILFIQILFNFFITLTPPTAWDGLSFHLVVPKLIIRHGSMVDLNYYGAGRYPLFIQMLFTLAFLMGGEQLVHMISWLTGIFTIIGIYSLSKMLNLGKAGLIGGAIFYCTQVVSMWTSTAYIDIYLAFFCIVSLILILTYLRTKARGVLILSFILISILPCVKETGVFLALIMGAFLTANLCRFLRQMPFSILILIFMFFIIFAAAIMPWYYQFGRNVPKAGPILGATDVGRGLSVEESFVLYLKKLFFVLWSLTVNCDRDGRISPLFLTFIPFIFFVRGNFGTRLLLFISLSYVVIFSIFELVLARYMLPVMPFLGLVSAYIVLQLLAKDYRTFRLLKLYLIFSFIFNLGLSVYNHLSDIDYLTGKIKRADYIARKVSCFRAMDYINRNIKTGRILLLGETRAYYLERDFLWGRKLSETPRDALLERLRGEGITHILASDYIIYKRRPDIKAQEILDELKDKSETIYKKGNFAVYQLLI